MSTYPRQMDRAVDLIERYQRVTLRKLWITDKLTSILLGNDETEWLDGFEKEVIRKEEEYKDFMAVDTQI